MLSRAVKQVQGDSSPPLALYSQRVQHMLGNRTSAQFIQLPKFTRDQILQRYLVSSTDVIIKEGIEDDLNDADTASYPGILESTLLRQGHWVGHDAASQQITHEAREIYYTQNAFVVRSHCLSEFLVDTLATGTPFRVDHLIRKICVIVDLIHLHDRPSMSPLASVPRLGRAAAPRDATVPTPTVRPDVITSWTVQDLQLVSAFTHATDIQVEIPGGGTLRGEDLLTQMKIREVARVVRDLILQFGPDRFRIQKYLQYPGQRFATTNDLTSYWDAPTADDRKSVRNGWASFPELMRVQISEWTREIPRTAHEMSCQSVLQ